MTHVYPNVPAPSADGERIVLDYQTTGKSNHCCNRCNASEGMPHREGCYYLDDGLPASAPSVDECEYDFPQAFKAMTQRGEKMRRLAWRPNKWVQQHCPDGRLPYLEMEVADGRRAPWTPTRCDLYGNDWVLL